MNIVHRDIKLQNILLKDGLEVKLIDFGFAFVETGEKVSNFCGTPSYMAPEIVQRRDHYGKPTDVWSLGVLLFKMLIGTFPFEGSS